MTARIIVPNGPSAAGKTTLVAALRPLMPDTFCSYASDRLADGGVPPRRILAMETRSVVT